MKKIWTIFLVLAVAGGLSAQEDYYYSEPEPAPAPAAPAPGPGPAPAGITFSGGVNTGLDIIMKDTGATFRPADGNQSMAGGDAVALRGALSNPTWGLNFALIMGANNTWDGFWTAYDIYLSQASGWWAPITQLTLTAGYWNDYTYFSTVNAYGQSGATGINLTVKPIEGLQFDIRFPVFGSRHDNGGTQYTDFSAQDGWWFVRNIDVGVKYGNPTFSFWLFYDGFAWPYGVLFGGDSGKAVSLVTQFTFTGVQNLTISLEGRLRNLLSEEDYVPAFTGPAGVPKMDAGLALNAVYTLPDPNLALQGRFLLGCNTAGVGSAVALAGSVDGFGLGVDLQANYGFSDDFHLIFNPVLTVNNVAPPANQDVEMALRLKLRANYNIAPGVPFAPASLYAVYFLDIANLTGANNTDAAFTHNIGVGFAWSF